MNWTDEQKSVIETEGSNILVSAAAGSGKTAVLVARIMRKILGGSDPVDVDRLLIVTFTRAAAAEMRQRLYTELLEMKKRDPGSERAARQILLLHHAEITTIDAFCADVVRNYGYTRDIAPGFRTADEGEIRLLERDIARKTVDDAFGSEGAEREGVELLADSFAAGRSDRILEDMILRVYRAAESDPDPEGWLRRQRSGGDAADIGQAPWMLEYLEDFRERIRNCLFLAEQNLEMAAAPGMPENCLEAARSDIGILEGLLAAEGYEELRRGLTAVSYKSLQGGKRGDAAGAELKKSFMKARDRLKKQIGGLQDELFPGSLSEAAAVEAKSGRVLDALLDLTERFIANFSEAKGKKNIRDFADIEHAALQILTGEGGRTPAAAELAERFSEVMIDEYQDSNYLQEAILTAVSRIPEGRGNYFCVGDVKQSIYSFRQARPELFMEKFRAYRENPGSGIRIDLHRNFRSGSEVIDTVNGIFEQIMIPEVGGISYDDSARLVKGAALADSPHCVSEFMPVFVGEKDSGGESVLGDTGSGAARECEARAVGERILELIRNGRLRDSDGVSLRPVSYRDIVILLRTVHGVADEMVRVLGSMGIPAYSEVGEGYFNAPEVQAVLSFLEILDNPRQDIPLAAVLHSAFVGLSSGELAEIAAGCGEDLRGKKGVLLIDRLRGYAAAGGDAALREKTADFLACLDRLRECVNYMPIHELIVRLLGETGFLSYVSAMPGGAQRELNLRLLVDRAADYGKTSYSGLFNFVRYIRNMEKQEIDPGEQSTLSGDDDVVRIFSIHKSKGLEFPVVFLTGLGRMFNFSSLNAVPLIHPDLGIAADYLDPVMRLRVPTIRKRALAVRLKRDQAGENLRILYVAMTRAKQKLILSGTIRDEKTLDEKRAAPAGGGGTLSPGSILGARSFLDWIIPAADRIFEEDRKTGRKPFLVFRPAYPSELAAAGYGAETRKTETLAFLGSLDPDRVYSTEMREAMEERFRFRYPYAGRENIPAETSVSELKRRAAWSGQADGSEELPAHRLYEEPLPSPIVPGFIRRKAGEEEEAGGGQEFTGAAAGTAYHRVMELLDFGALEAAGGDAAEAVRAQIAAMRAGGRLGAEETEAVDPGKIVSFVESPIGKRFAAAAAAGRLVREQPYVSMERASDLDADWPSDEEVLVQGIIDAYFIEDGAVVLVDYKTDRVRDGAELLRRYRIQLRLYARALQAATGLPVSEKIIWSFALGAEIRAD